MPSAQDLKKTYATRTAAAAEHLMDIEIAQILMAGAKGMLASSPQNGGGNLHADAPFVNRIALEAFGSTMAGLEDGLIKNQFIVQHRREHAEDFATRLMLLEYDDIYWRAARQLAARPFSKEIGWSDETPEEVIAWADNIEIPDSSATVSGVDFRTFGRNVCTQSTGFGSVVLYPQVNTAGDRAFITTLPIHSILGVRHRNEAGHRRESRVIVHTRQIVDAIGEEGFVDFRGDGFHEITEEAIIIFYDGDPASQSEKRFAGFEIYRRDGNGDWPPRPTEKWRPIRPLVEIPLVPLGTGTGHLWFRPPVMRHLARSERVLINKVSDFNHSMKTASVPIWSWSGVTKKELREYTSLNAGNVFQSTAEGALMRPVEFTGSAMQIYAANIDRHRAALHGMSNAPMITQASGSPMVEETATKTATNYSETMTEAEAAVLGWESALTRAVRIGARRTNMDEKAIAGIGVRLYHDFQVGTAQAEKVQTWTTLLLEEKMPPDEYYGLLHEIGWLSEDFDSDATVQWIDDHETKVLSQITRPPSAPEKEDSSGSGVADDDDGDVADEGADAGEA